MPRTHAGGGGGGCTAHARRYLFATNKRHMWMDGWISNNVKRGRPSGQIKTCLVNVEYLRKSDAMDLPRKQIRHNLAPDMMG